uniref:Uncharacterized protein n=1 Tax=Rhizophora mucronata TaxID=61149 RepID=A0A2P2KDS4_RHIMU
MNNLIMRRREWFIIKSTFINQELKFCNIAYPPPTSKQIKF